MAAIQLDSRFVEPCVTLAFIALKQGRLIEAVAASERALIVMPDLAEAHFYRASAHTALGNLAEAKGSLLAVMESPDIEYIPMTYFLFGNVLAREGRFSEAAEHFTRYINLEPDSKTAAAAAAQLKEWKQAGYLPSLVKP